jgi:hypothetical protein
LLLVGGCITATGSAAPATGPLKVFLGITGRFEPSPTGGRELVAEVVQGGPADRGGVQKGDWILGFGGKPHTASSLSALLDSLGWIEAGKPLELDILRQGKQLRLTLVPELATPGQQAALLSFLEECRKKGGCNELCSSEEVAPEISLRQFAAEHGEVRLVFIKDPATGEPKLLKSQPALPSRWEFRTDPVFSDGHFLVSVRHLLEKNAEVTAVYQQKEPGRFSLALKI